MISVSSGCGAADGGLMALGSSVGIPVAVVGAKPAATVADDVLSRSTVVGSHDCELVTVRVGAMLVTPSPDVETGGGGVTVGSVPLPLDVVVITGGGVTVGEGVVVMTSGPLVVAVVVTGGGSGVVVFDEIGGGSTTGPLVVVVMGGSGGGVVVVTTGGSVTGPVPLGVVVGSGIGMRVVVGNSMVVTFGRGRALVRISSISLNRELRGSVLLVVGSGVGAGVVSGASVVMAVVGHSTMLDDVEMATGSATDTTVELDWDLTSVRDSVFSVVSVVELLDSVGETKGVLWTPSPLDVSVLETVGKRFSMTPSTTSLKDFCPVVVALAVSVSVVGVISSGATVMLVNWRLTCRG